MSSDIINLFYYYRPMVRRLFLLSFIVPFLFSCAQSEVNPEVKDAPQIKQIVVTDSLFFVGHKIVFSAQFVNPTEVSVLWRLNGKELSRQITFDLTPELSGGNVLELVAVNDKGRDSTELVFDVLRPRGSTSSKWISKVFEYNPAPGQFINTSAGNEQAAQGLVGNRGMVSLGGYGGNIIFGFDHTVINGSGADFVVHGNAFEGSSEPGAVAVAFDTNGNGLPDDDFYELRASAYDKAAKNLTIKYIKPQQTESAENVAWQTSLGLNGQIDKVEFHKQCYYPLFGAGASGASEIGFSGNLVANPSVLGQDGIWVTPALEWGYVDNYTSDYDDQIGEDPQTARSTKFDVANAMATDGSAVSLKGIDFVKVYTCVNEQAGPLGESSTDVCGAISLTAVR